MPTNPGKIKTDGGSYYLHAPERTIGPNKGDVRLISPRVMAAVALRYEQGQNPYTISIRMQLPKTAVDDIIATYEHRARMFFKMSRRRA